jgi:hypothetical protein
MDEDLIKFRLLIRRVYNHAKLNCVLSGDYFLDGVEHHHHTVSRTIAFYCNRSMLFSILTSAKYKNKHKTLRFDIIDSLRKTFDNMDERYLDEFKKLEFRHFL